MHLIIEHHTQSSYAPEVEEAWHLAFLRPSEHGQRLCAHSLRIDPEPDHQHSLTDPFGNHATWFSLHRAHQSIDVIATSEVHTHEPQALPADQAWEAARDAMRYRKAAPFDAATEFLHPSPLVPLHDEFTAHALQSFTPGRGLIEASLHYCQRIHTEFRYDPVSTDVNTPALEALRERHGVCQDFAHVLIAGLRAIGLPARYVSGYMLTEPPPGQPRLIGADASHAWAAVYLAPTTAQVAAGQSGTWIDLDPTNNRFGNNTPGPAYVRLAIGRDYSDITPLRGVIHGAQRQSQTVGVTVRPAVAPQAASD